MFLIAFDEKSVLSMALVELVNPYSVPLTIPDIIFDLDIWTVERRVRPPMHVTNILKDLIKVFTETHILNEQRAIEDKFSNARANNRMPLIFLKTSRSYSLHDIYTLSNRGLVADAFQSFDTSRTDLRSRLSS